MAASYKNPPVADAAVRSQPLGAAALRQAFAFRGDVQGAIIADEASKTVDLEAGARAMAGEDRTPLDIPDAGFATV